MQRALAGRGDHPFDVPDSIRFVDIDRDTGATATPGCLRVFSESFLAGIRTDAAVRTPPVLGSAGLVRPGEQQGAIIDDPHMSQEVFEALTEALERGEDAALVTIVSANGSTPQRVGAKMLVFPDGRTVGTIGGGCYENDAFWKAKDAIQSRKPPLVKYDLNDDFAQENGLVCGGQMQVYIEPLEATPRLYVIGAGHVGYHLARLAHTIGFRTHVLDDREKFANTRTLSRCRGSDRRHDSRVAAPRRPPTERVRRHRDARAHARSRRAALARRARPAVSRADRQQGQGEAHLRRAARRRHASGMPAARHAPVGLDIGAVSPEEIAVAILAELIAVRRGKIQDPKLAAVSMRWDRVYNRCLAL